MVFVIYAIENNINGKLYIGQTSKSAERRWEAHKKNAKRGVNRKLYDAINKYGTDNFTVHHISEVPSRCVADRVESMLILLFNTMGSDGYNMTEGGGGGYTLGAWCEEDKMELYKTQAKSRTGSKRTPQERKNISDACIGRAVREETKAKISETLKRRYSSGEIKSTLPAPRYGKDHPGYKECSIDLLIALAEKGYTFQQMCGELGLSRYRIRREIRLCFGLTVNEFRRKYAIKN